MNIINKKIELPDGRVIEIETGKLAKQAAGSAVVKMGGTMLLATVTCAKEVKEGTDILPAVSPAVSSSARAVPRTTRCSSPAWWTVRSAPSGRMTSISRSS